MSKAEILKKLYLYKQNPNLVKEVSNAELADLVVLVMTAVQSIEESMESKRVDVEKKYDTQAKQVLTKAEKDAQALLSQVTAEVNRLLDKGEQTLGQTATELEKRVAESIANLRNGNDGIVTEAEIERAAAMALGMLELPDFDALVTEAITSNSEAIRDALELLTGEDRYRVEIADVQGLEDALDRLSKLKGSSVGGIGKSQVYDFIRQAIAEGIITSGGASTFLDLTDTPSSYSGQAGKAVVVNGTADGLEFVPLSGGGDMLASTYDPANGARQVAFADELHSAVTVTDSAEIDFTLTGQDITASLKNGSIDESKLDASVNASLDLADSAVQPSGLTNYFLKTVDDTDDITEGATNKFATAAEKTKLGHITVTQAVDLDAIETRVNQLDAAVVLKGSWDASAGTFPGSGTAQAGDSYIVSVGGTVDSVVFNVGDRIVAILDNASTSTYASNWLKLDYTDQVSSVAGKTGAVTLVTADITDITASAAELNILDGATVTTAELNILDGVTATASELNALDGITATVTELNYTDGVTSAIQTQLDAKASLTGTETLTNKTITAPKLTVSNLSNLGATETVDWSAADIFYGTLDSNVNITHSNEASGRTITIHLAYDGSAQRTITWTDVDRWTDNSTGAAPTTPSASGKVLTVTMQYYGTTCVASATGNYAVYA